MNSREIWTIDVSTGICLQLIVKTNETPRQETRVEARRRTNDQMAVTNPVAFELNREPMDGETLTADEELPITDELIAVLVHQALFASGYGQLRHLQAYCDHGRVTLQGRLPTYHLKQVAQSLIDSMPGVRDIDNDVIVFSPR